MAELVGVIAGGAGLASLAIQIAESSAKLRRLYQSCREAPQSLEDVLNELATLGLTLNALEREWQQRNAADRTIVEHCIHMCHRAAARISVLVDKLEDDMHTSRIKGRVITAFSQRKIEKLRDELEKAKTSLILALHLNTASSQNVELARQKEDIARIREKLHCDATATQHEQVIAAESTRMNEGDRAFIVTKQHGPQDQKKENPVAGMKKQTEQIHYQPRRKKNGPVWRISLSSWFTRKIWEISFAFAQTGFDFNLRTYNFVPHNALIFQACRTGDIGEVRALFDSGEASPFDCYSQEIGAHLRGSVLSTAAESGNVQLCRYIIEAVGFPVGPKDAGDPLSAFAVEWESKNSVSGAENLSEPVEMYRLLIRQLEWPVDGSKSSSLSQWVRHCPDAECARLLKDAFSFDFSEMTWESKVDFAIKNGAYGSRYLPEIFLMMLDHQAVNSDVAQASDSRGFTALHMISTIIAYHSPGVLMEWTGFVGQLLENGADIHQVNNDGHTPFVELLRWTMHCHPLLAIKTWIYLLVSAGVDLLFYEIIELAYWEVFTPEGVETLSRRINAWTLGPCLHYSTVTFQLKRTLTIHRLVGAPGSWPTCSESNTTVLPWEPEMEDEPNGPLQWSKVDHVTIYGKQTCSSDLPCIDPSEYRFSGQFQEPQDDCGSIMRLLRTSSKPGRQRRAYSLPRLTGFPRTLVVNRDRAWLPEIHVCWADGLARFCHYLDVSHRRCAKGIHYRDSRYELNYREKIMQQMRFFQNRYCSEEELRSLPYTAYHPTWTGGRPVGCNTWKFPTTSRVCFECASSM